MSFGFLNAAMLAGLGVVALPIIAHLLSKRRYDIVPWGAMRFLELGQKTRRKIQLQDLLLLLMRIAAVGAVALAICRPWGQGGVFGKLAGAVSRDVVFVVDGSYSMGWEGHAVTPHAAAIQWVHEALEELRPGDTAVILDARESPRLIGTASADLNHVREVVDKLPAPAGSSDIPATLLEGMKSLAATMNVSREIILLTDQQQLPWRLDDDFLWTRVDDLQKQPTVKPTISVVNLAETTEDRPNFSVDRLQLSRELTVPDFPIRIRAVLRQSGGAKAQVRVNFEVNGQIIPELVREVQLLANGEAIVELEHRFDNIGSYLISMSVEHDDLPADNRSSAVVRVEDGIPVLIVDGHSHLDPTRTESFFVKSALDASGVEAPWVRSRVIPIEELSFEQIGTARVVFLCNAQRLSLPQAQLLTTFVNDGGGLIIAPGDQTDPQAWNILKDTDELPFLPAAFDQMQVESGKPEEVVTVDHPSLKSQWLERFRKESGVDFCAARFSRWWRLKVHSNFVENGAEASSAPDAEILARLTSTDPLLVSQRRGDGQIIQLSVPLDADWSTLPARSDFVPFLHEMIFVLTSATAPRNLELGAPLLFTLTEKQEAKDFNVTGPGIDEPRPLEPFFSGRLRLARFGEARLPGTYRVAAKGDADTEHEGEPYVVNFDRAESNLTPLAAAEWEQLTANDRMRAITAMEEQTRALATSQSRAELWWGLLVFVLCLLILEIALTRHMVKGGHVVLDDVAPRSRAPALRSHDAQSAEQATEAVSTVH